MTLAAAPAPILFALPDQRAECGSWLEEVRQGPGVVVVRVLPHLGAPGETYPFLGVWPYVGNESAQWLEEGQLLEFSAPNGGLYRLTLGSSCGTCATIEVDVPAVLGDHAAA